MKHNLIKTDKYLLVVDNKIPQPGDYMCILSRGKGGRPNKYIVVAHDKGRSAKLAAITDGASKIIAHYPLNGAPYLFAVDVLPPSWRDSGEDVDKLAREEILYNDVKREWWKQGYNKAREKYEFTKEDMRKAIIMSSLSTVDFIPDRCDVIIQTIQQPKLPIGFECEMITRVYDVYPQRTEYKPKTIINAEGRTEWVGKYIYE